MDTGECQGSDRRNRDYSKCPREIGKQALYAAESVSNAGIPVAKITRTGPTPSK